MKLSGKLVKGTKIVNDVLIEINEEGKPYRDALEDCLILACRELDIPVPLWLHKNTSEFVNYKRTSFGKDQFVETIKFDRFDIRVM